MITRLIEFYKKSQQGSQDTMSQLWRIITERNHSDLHNALNSKDPDKVSLELDRMSESGGLYGIDNPVPLSGQALDHHLQHLACTLGIIPVQNPEQPFTPPIPDNLRDMIEADLDMRLNIPECFGFKNSQGVPSRLVYYLASWKSIESVYGVTQTPSRVLEIGGGIGLLGYLCYIKGILSYTVIDLPLVAVINAYFASHYCPECQIWMWGEDYNEGAFARYYPSTHLELPESASYDLVYNSDSFPEMTNDTQIRYLQLIRKHLVPEGRLLSINHESSSGGQRRVYDACREFGGFDLIRRSPWFMRNGYVEELWAPIS